MKRRSRRVQEKINAVTFGFGGRTRIATALHRPCIGIRPKHEPRGPGARLQRRYDTDEPEALARVLAQMRAPARVFSGSIRPSKPPKSARWRQARAEVARFMPGL